MPGEPSSPRNTREVAALWSETVEEHLTRPLTQVLPELVGDARPMDQARAAVLAHHLAHALRLAALSGDQLKAMLWFGAVAAGINCSRIGANPPTRAEVEKVVGK